ncbi:MAG TPA: hypothetical protein VGZ90_07950 [Puia sp.]|jgi:hypothetical protein|nr:hypothetical protein [Puia sp.]
MKKLMIILICAGFAYGAEAQSHGGVAGVHSYGYIVQPRISVGFGYYPFYSPFGYYGLPYGAYYPYGAAYARPSNLERKENEIRSDYSDRIFSVHQDSSLTSKQKRQEIRALKKQRKQDIHDLVVNYHKQPVTK